MQPPFETTHLLNNLKKLTDHGELNAEIIDDYQDDDRNPPENVPAQAVRDQALKAQDLIAEIPTLTQEAMLPAWTQIQELLTSGASNAAQCQEHCVGYDQEATDNMEDSWKYVQEVLDNCAATATAAVAYWQSQQDTYNPKLPLLANQHNQESGETKHPCPAKTMK